MDKNRGEEGSGSGSGGSSSSQHYTKGGYHRVKYLDYFKQFRYSAESELGSATSYTLWLARDTLHKKYVALKIHKSAQHYTAMALKEIDILVEISQGNRDGNICVVKLLDHFMHTGPNGVHVCMVFEHTGDNLLALIEHYGYKGIPLNMVKEICSSVLVGLDYLHGQHSLIHTALKPENILLPFIFDHKGYRCKSGIPPLFPHFDLKCKIDGLVNACWTHKHILSHIQSCGAYTCPEILVLSELSTSADIWSVGCIAFQLVTGKSLFDPQNGDSLDMVEDHLAQMVELLGVMPKEIAFGGKLSTHYFNSDGGLIAIRQSESRSLIKVLRETSQFQFQYSEQDADEFCNFLLPLLNLLPHERPTAAQALLHPWLNAGPRLLQPSLSSAQIQKSDDAIPENKT